MKKLLIFIGLFISLLTYSQLSIIDGIYYENDELFSGQYTEYYDNGNIRIQLYIMNGQKNGECYDYYENGKVKELRSYKNNEFHGNFKTWNEKGNLIGIATYKDGKKDGEWIIYVNNNIKYKLNFKDDKKSGKSYMYDDNGDLQVIKEY